MTPEKLKETKEKIANDPDFINSKKYKYSMARYIKRNPVSPDNLIALLLCMTEDEVDETFQDAVIKIRQFMGIEV